MTKRYILLVGSNYYPHGWDDFRGSFDSVEEAKTYAHSFESDDILSQDYKWAEIIDKETLKVVASCYSFEDETEETLWDITVEEGDNK